MKKHLLTTVALAAALGAQAQTDVLLIGNDEEAYAEYKVADVREFDVASPMTVTLNDGTTRQHEGVTAFWFDQLAAISNQYQLIVAGHEDISGIHDITAFRAIQHYDIATQRVDSTAYWLDDNVCLSVGADNHVLSTWIGAERYFPTDPTALRVTKNKLNSNITLSGDLLLLPSNAEPIPPGYKSPRFRVEVTADPLTTYASEQAMSVESFQTEPFSGTVGTVLYKPVVGISGGSPVIVIGDAVATDAEGMRQGRYALQVSLAGNRFKNGNVDLSETDSYSIILYDYAEGKTKEITSHYKGHVTTLADPEKNGENIYLHIDFDAEAGVHFTAEYFGPLTTVTDLDGLAPKIAETNNVILTNQSGVQTLNQEITSMQVRESNDGTIYLYMMTDGTAPDNSMQTPCVQISPAHVNAGELSLPDLAEQWSISFKSINVAYAKTEWHPAITNGTLSVSKADDGQWDVTVSLKNEYNNMGTISGTGESLTIHYAGPASAYTGTKK